MTTSTIIEWKSHFPVADTTRLAFDDSRHGQVIGAGERHENLCVATVTGHPGRVRLVGKIGAGNHPGLGWHQDIHVERHAFRNIGPHITPGLDQSLLQRSHPIDEAKFVGRQSLQGRRMPAETDLIHLADKFRGIFRLCRAV